VNGILGQAWSTTVPGSAWAFDGATDMALQLISGGDVVASNRTMKSKVIGNSRVQVNNERVTISSMRPMMISDFSNEPNVTHRKNTNTAGTDDLRMLLGYKVYRDGTEIAEILDPNQLTYDDLCLNGGTYEYWVTAIYDEGESDPSNAEEVTVILYAPQNLSAIVQGMNNVFCTWDAPAERTLDGYNIYRDGVLISDVTSTFYLDIGLAAGDYVYNVTAVYCGEWESGFSNNGEVTVDVGDPPLPLVTELHGNYPNPFNPETSIKFALNEAGNVRIDVFNTKGQHVRTVVNEHLEAAYHSVVWDGKDASGVSVSSGVYFYKMDAGKYTSIKKMILMK